MEKKNLSKKQELTEELGMRFEEASELFSEETLETMRMVHTVGGSDEDTEGFFLVCPKAKDNCDCVDINVVNCAKCGQEKNKTDGGCGSTVVLDPPTLPTPTIAVTTLPPPVIPDFPDRPTTSTTK